MRHIAFIIFNCICFSILRLIRAALCPGQGLRVMISRRVYTVLLILASMALSAMTAFAESPEALQRKQAGNEYQKRKDYPAARDQYLEALKIEPDYSDVHYNLGMLYFYRLKDYERALYHLNYYRKMSPGASDTAQVISHIGQAIEQLEAEEREDYKSAVDAGTLDGFEAFIRRHPVGYYSRQAEEEIKKILRYRDERTRLEAEETEAYSNALLTNTTEALNGFLARYPMSTRANEVREKLKILLERMSTEAEAYSRAAHEDSAAALENFLKAYPESMAAPKARDRLNHLKAAEEAFSLARDSGSVAALEKFLEMFPDVPQTEPARGLLVNIKKAKVEKAASEEAEKALKEGGDVKAPPEGGTEVRPEEKKGADDGAGLTTPEEEEMKRRAEARKRAQDTAPPEPAKPADGGQGQ